MLRRLVPQFEVQEAEVDEAEVHARWTDPRRAAMETALAKALDVSRRVVACPERAEGAGLVLGFDTVVVADGCAMGKPRSEEEAVSMLLRLGGRDHRVITGVAAIAAEDCDPTVKQLDDLDRLFPGAPYEARGIAVDVGTTTVWFRPLTEAVVRDSVACGESLDKAGGYGIQGMGSLLVERIEGCYFNVVGLPLQRTSTLLSRFGIGLEEMLRYGQL